MEETVEGTEPGWKTVKEMMAGRENLLEGQHGGTYLGHPVTFCVGPDGVVVKTERQSTSVHKQQPRWCLR